MKLQHIFKTAIDTVNLYISILHYELLSHTSSKLPECNQKKALILAPKLPPYVSGGVYRPMSWAKYSSDNGWVIDFLTHAPDPTVDYGTVSDHLVSQLNDCCSIFHVPTATSTPSWKLSPRIDGSFVDALKAVAVALNIYKDHTPTVIVATGPSFDYFITGYYLSRILKVPLILDYRDEWTQSPFEFIKKGNCDEYWERRVYEHAKSVIFTTESMRQYHIQKYINARKTHVVANGWESSEHTTNSQTHKPICSTIKLMFVGLLGSHSPPNEFLHDIFTLLQKPNNTRIEIHFVGKVSQHIKMEMGKNIYKNFLFFEDFLPRNIANKRMNEATALLLFTPINMSRYIPGKLFDYLATGKPIIVHGEEGEVSRIIESLSAGYFVPNGDLESLGFALKNIIEDSHKDKNTDRELWLSEHSREHLASKFYNILDQSSP
jgi:glycosyltransferase involved in cell wall biosynthesis